MDISIESVWAVIERVNPHIPSAGHEHIVVMYKSKEAAENFLAIHPQYHLKWGVAEPKIILEIKELPLDRVASWWTPSFP